MDLGRYNRARVEEITCGISWEGSILDAALARGIVEKRGSWIAYGSSQLGQGSMATIQYLKDHPDIAAEIVEKVKTAPVVAAKKK